MEELKPCPFCGNFKKVLPNAICSFGKDFPDDRPEGAMLFCLRHSANGYELHAEAISIDDDGNECCEYDGNAEINFCPICGKPLNHRAAPENKALTLEQLRQMDGSWVWLVDEKIPDYNGWYKVVTDSNDFTLRGIDNDYYQSAFTHGIAKAYVRKPEGSDKP